MLKENPHTYGPTVKRKRQKKKKKKISLAGSVACIFVVTDKCWVVEGDILLSCPLTAPLDIFVGFRCLHVCVWIYVIIYETVT